MSGQRISDRIRARPVSTAAVVVAVTLLAAAWISPAGGTSARAIVAHALSGDAFPTSDQCIACHNAVPLPGGGEFVDRGGLARFDDGQLGP